MNYKDIFENAYNSQIQSLHQKIKASLIEYKSENRNFQYADRMIENRLHQEKSNAIDLGDEHLKELEETHRIYEMSYEDEFKSSVLYKELKNKFEELIDALAKFNATKEVYINYNSYSYNLRDMYKSSKFEGYKSFKTFDLIELDKTGNHALCDELSSIKNPKPKEANPNSNILNKDKFELKKQYERKSKEVNFYNDIVNDFFDENSITHLEFIKLFIDREILNHPIKFHCETNKAASFIYSLKDYFFKRLSINYLLKNQIFLSFDNTKLTGTNLFNTKSKNHLHDFSSLSSKLLDHSL